MGAIRFVMRAGCSGAFCYAVGCSLRGTRPRCDESRNIQSRKGKQCSDGAIYSRIARAVHLRRTVESAAMPNLQVVSNDDLPVEATPAGSSTTKLVVQWIVGIVVVFGLGTWLVWWTAAVQRTSTMEDIRAACQRVMPETVERCVDTVILQRGGARR